ncbi:inverse autotransporter beta domain-containing protein [Escherichia coli]
MAGMYAQKGWLPASQHLGGKLVYEQYYGDEVALFDKDDRQSNPHAITAGLNYTPFPLITLARSNARVNRAKMTPDLPSIFTWQPGSAMQKQLDPNEVAARRSLPGSRYDLVDRNNNIVLEYRTGPPDPDRPRDREVRRSEITGFVATN